MLSVVRRFHHPMRSSAEEKRICAGPTYPRCRPDVFGANVNGPSTPAGTCGSLGDIPFCRLVLAYRLRKSPCTIATRATLITLQVWLALTRPSRGCNAAHTQNGGRSSLAIWTGIARTNWSTCFLLSPPALAARSRSPLYTR